MSVVPNNSIFGLFRRNGDNTKSVSEQENTINTDGTVNEFNTNIGASILNIRERYDKTAPYSINEIINMAKNPMNHISSLRRWSRWAYYSNGTISSAIDSLKGLFSLDYVVVSKPKNVGQKINYTENYYKMDNILRTIRYKEAIRDGIFRDASEGMYVAYFETRRVKPEKKALMSDRDIEQLTEINADGNNISIIPLPVDFVRIVGRRNNCYEVAFDLRYFNDLSGDVLNRRLRRMPKQIQDGYDKYRNTNDDSSCWLMLDWKKTIVSKIKSKQSDPYGVPFAVAALDDVEYAKYFTNTKRQVLGTVNNQIYYETFPEGKDKGTSALTKTQQESQHKTIKEALTSRGNNTGVSFFSVASGTKMDRLPVDISLLDEENENGIKEDVNKGIGFSAAALDGSSSGNYATATLNMELICNNVFTWIEEIVEEINKCINYNVIKNKDCLVEFSILPITFLNRDKAVKNYADLYARGKGSLTAWVAACGINVHNYISLMDYELEEDFENKYPVHKTSFTITGKDSPEYEDVDGNKSTNPSTISTTTNNGNASPSPSE